LFSAGQTRPAGGGGVGVGVGVGGGGGGGGGSAVLKTPGMNHHHQSGKSICPFDGMTHHHPAGGASDVRTGGQLRDEWTAKKRMDYRMEPSKGDGAK
jgi:hypothetical protein